MENSPPTMRNDEEAVENAEGDKSENGPANIHYDRRRG
jgi:hypothetical protein